MQMQAKLDVNSELKLLVRGQFGLEPSPYNKILKETAQTMFRAAQELGFSPTARPRLSAEPPPPTCDPDDPWTQLRLVPGGRQDPG
jgi:phage terminase small subunit